MDCKGNTGTLRPKDLERVTFITLELYKRVGISSAKVLRRGKAELSFKLLHCGNISSRLDPTKRFAVFLLLVAVEGYSGVA